MDSEAFAPDIPNDLTETSRLRSWAHDHLADLYTPMTQYCLGGDGVDENGWGQLKYQWQWEAEVNERIRGWSYSGRDTYEVLRYQVGRVFGSRHG